MDGWGNYSSIGHKSECTWPATFILLVVRQWTPNKEKLRLTPHQITKTSYPSGRDWPFDIRSHLSSKDYYLTSLINYAAGNLCKKKVVNLVETQGRGCGSSKIGKHWPFYCEPCTNKQKWRHGCSNKNVIMNSFSGILCPRLGAVWIGRISWLPRAPLGPIFMTGLPER